MPIYMRLPKRRGSTSKDAMPIGPHRTFTQPVNVQDLERVFDDGAEVTLDALVEKGLLKNLRTDVKLLGDGEVSKQFHVTVHRASESAKAKIDAAGGSVTELKEVKKKKRRRRSKAAPAVLNAATDSAGPSVDDSGVSENEPDSEKAKEGS